MAEVQRTFAMVKPDGVARGLVGNVIARYEGRGLKIVGLKLVQVSDELASTHYGEHEGKPFYNDLVSFITSGPVAAMVIEGPDAVRIVRDVNGATNPVEAAPGSVRGDLAVEIGRNVAHGSDSAETAAREVKLWFDDAEIASYARADEAWTRE